jgi:hypothetical protein
MGILIQAARVGAISCKVASQLERFERLEQEGYLYRIPPQLILARMPPSPVSWEPTEKCFEAVTSRIC